MSVATELSYKASQNSSDFSSSLKSAISQGFNISEKIVPEDRFGNSPLEYSNFLAYCARDVDFDVFKEIAGLYTNKELENTHIVSASKEKIPLLHLLAAKRYSDYEPANDEIKYLIEERKYPVNQKDENGYTALNAAQFAGNLTSATLLLEHGADPFNKTPFTKYQTIYDAWFDKEGNYRDFNYQHHEANFEPNKSYFSNEYNQQRRREQKEATILLESHLQKIRALCKPEYEGKPLFSDKESEGLTLKEKENLWQKKQFIQRMLKNKKTKVFKIDDPLESRDLNIRGLSEEQHWGAYQFQLKQKYPEKYKEIQQKIKEKIEKDR